MLRHRDVLALAASCGELFRGVDGSGGHVRLVRSIHDHAASPWLEISLPQAPEEDVTVLARAREAVDVLRALARCPGYAPHLNTYVWEDILHRMGVAIGDTNGLRLDKSFPRVRLNMEAPAKTATVDRRHDEAKRVDRALRCFAQLGDEYTGSRSVIFEKTTTVLREFVRPPDFDPRRPLDVTLQLPSMDTQKLLPVVAAFTRACPLVGVQVVQLSLHQKRHQPKDPLDALRWLSDLPDMPSISQWTLDEEVDDPRVYVKLYRRLLGVDGREPTTKIHTLQVVLPNVGESQFQAICSALPFARTVQRLWISRDVDYLFSDILDRDREWAWLSYAIFHEQTASSTWKEFEIDDCAFGENSIRGLLDVQRGGIAALSHYWGDDHGGARYAKQTQFDVRADGSLWYVEDLHDRTNSELVLDDLCVFDVVRLPRPETFGDGVFQACMVPGVGIAYAHDDEGASLVATCEGDDSTSHSSQDERPRRASLTSLSVFQVESVDSSLSGLMAAVRACGNSLTSVKLATRHPLTSPEVGQILVACPNLASLSIDHDGTFWTSWDATHTQVYPKMTSIRQTCSLIDAFTTVTAVSNIAQPSFPSVRELSFRVTKGCAAFPSIAKALGVILLANPTIEELTMTKLLRFGSQTRSSEEMRRKRLAQLGLPREYLLLSTHPINRGYDKTVRMALQPLAHGRSLPIEVFTTVLSFVGGVRHRRVDFEQV